VSYKYANAYDWLSRWVEKQPQTAEGMKAVAMELARLACDLDSEGVEDYWQDPMDADGYFDPDESDLSIGQVIAEAAVLGVL